MIIKSLILANQQGTLHVLLIEYTIAFLLYYY